jgi:hypothetical protein
MSKFRKIPIILSISLITFILILPSCIKIPSLTADINGNKFKALYIMAMHGTIPKVDTGFVIMAGDNVNLDTARFLAILIRGDKPGTYRVDQQLTNFDSIMQAAAIYSPHGNKDTTHFYYAKKGFVKITKVDLVNNKIDGSFQFTMYDKDNNPIEISDGKFEQIIYVDLNNANLTQLDLFNH